jgi:CRP-like cAMP-binding protein
MSINHSTSQYEKTILGALPPMLLSDYLAGGKFLKQSYNKNEIIHLEGDECTQIEIIMQGEIVIERIGLSGDLMTVNHFGKGDIIGANLIFSSTDCYPMTITSKKYTEVIVVQKDVLFELCNSYPTFLMQFIKVISDLSVLIGTKMKNRISRTIRQSIITYLSKQSKLQNSYSITITMSKKSLAEMFGVSRTSLSRELQKMAAENLITFDAKTIQILNIDILE